MNLFFSGQPPLECLQSVQENMYLSACVCSNESSKFVCTFV